MIDIAIKVGQLWKDKDGNIYKIFPAILMVNLMYFLTIYEKILSLFWYYFKFLT